MQNRLGHHNFFITVLNLPKYDSTSKMFVNLNIPSLDKLLQKLLYSFRSRIYDSGNSLVKGIVKSSVPLFSKIWTWWSDILNT